MDWNKWTDDPLCHPTWIQISFCGVSWRGVYIMVICKMEVWPLRRETFVISGLFTFYAMPSYVAV